MTDLEALKAQISDEADLCRNEGATDIASLLDDTRYTIEIQAREIARLRGALADPHKVHANMLAGYIAKPTPKQILHIYGADAFRAALAGDSHDQ